jgi:hypothetical protein
VEETAMADESTTPEPDNPPDALLEGEPGPAFGLTADDYREGFGEELADTLAVERWRGGLDLAAEYGRVEREVRDAVAREDELHRRLRAEVHKELRRMEGAPRGAGVHEVTLEEIREVHRGLLFNGGVEACDGTSHVHDTLALTMYQIGVCLVSYQGDQGAWGQRLFRRDLRLGHGDVVTETIELLRRRARRGGLHQPQARDILSELGRRSIMSFAERAVLLRRSKSVWRLGHGNPAALELFTSLTDLMIESIRLIRGIVEGHQKFVYVASEPGDRLLLSIGHSLQALEYAIVTTLRDRIADALDHCHYTGELNVDPRWDEGGEELRPEEWLIRFRDEVCSKVVVGVYRATPLAPPHVFYAHEDHADIAARIVLADSVFQDYRGYPALIDLADHVCRSVYGGGTLRELADHAYAAAGVPFRYQSERLTRRP